MAGIHSLLNKVRKATGSMSFQESKYGTITDFIDTGSYALNRIISGDIYKGIPSGRVIVLAGESQTAKSYISAQIASNALLTGYDHIFYFDSEGGALKEFFKNKGCDLNKVEHILLENVEDATVKILEVYRSIMEYKESNPDAKFLCILDSLGALVTTKVYTDAEKGKQVSEMGGRAKLCLDGNTLILMSNNTYKLLKDIEINDEVITHLGKIKKVKDKFTSKHKQYLKFKVNGKEIKMSLNHKMLISRNNELMYCEAKDILQTDKFIKLNI